MKKEKSQKQTFRFEEEIDPKLHRRELYAELDKLVQRTWERVNS